MECSSIFCAGKGFVSTLFCFVLSITLFFHIFGFISPKWYCDGEGCEFEGLYYSCDTNDVCHNSVTDEGILTAIVLVLCSNIFLVLAFCFVVQCTSYREQTLGPSLISAIGGWFVIQEVVSAVTLIIIRLKYDEIGWSAYCFSMPGIIMMSVVILIQFYQLCWPEETVHPDKI